MKILNIIETVKKRFPDEKIHEAFRMAEEVYDLSMCSLQSFDYDNLLRAHAAFPALNIMLTCWEHNTDVDRCLTDGFDIDMDYRNVKDNTIEQFHAKGLKVGLWTANTEEALAFCLARNVDYIESDVFADADGN